MDNNPNCSRLSGVNVTFALQLGYVIHLEDGGGDGDGKERGRGVPG